jgi:hypothetical protein
VNCDDLVNSVDVLWHSNTPHQLLNVCLETSQLTVLAAAAAAAAAAGEL